jgi:hypothetical protein
LASTHRDKHPDKLLYSAAATAIAARAAAVVVVEVLVEAEALEDQEVRGRIVLVLIPREVTTMIQNWG